MMDVEQFFSGRPASASLFEALRARVDTVGEVQVRVTKSQIAFRRRTGFAWAWIPGKYLHGKRPPLVLSLALRRHDSSPRWKEVVEPAPGRFMHHLELNAISDIDDQVASWLREAWTGAD